MMNTERMIIRKIEGTLVRDLHLDPAGSDLSVACDGGRVVLDGTVETVAAKRLAVRKASQTPGVTSVDDHLRVAPPSTMGDLEIAEHVRHAFLQERNIEEEHIEIEVDADGGVTLRGHVHSLVQRRLCEVLCWWVPAVTDVRNLLTVEPPEADSDEELRDNLVTILEKDVLVNPKKFRLEVRDGVVTLRGRVDSPIERSAAENDCWFTPGVVGVSNGLTVG
jgi:osmotically-inducible protein OsmY